MKANLYAFRDRKANIYGTPFVSPNHSVAKREFNAFCNQTPNIYLAEDMELYFLGVFDNETGEVFGASKPEFMFNYVKENNDG